MSTGSRRHPDLLRAALLAAVLVPVLLLAGLTLAPPARADTHDDPSGVRVQITQITPSVLRPGDDLTIRGIVHNDSEETIENAIVRMVMQKHTPATATAMTAWLDGTNSANTTVLTAEELDAEIDPGSSVPFTISIPTEASPFDELSAWGPRGFEVVVSTPQIRAADRNMLLWFPEESPLPAPTEVSVLVPLTPTAAEWNDAISTDTPVGEVAATRITGLLEATDHRAVSWALDPALLERRGPAPDDFTDLAPVEEALPQEPEDTDAGSAETPDQDSDAANGQAENGEAESTQTPAETFGTNAESGGLIEELVAGSRGRDVLSLAYADADLSALAHAQDMTMWRVGADRSRSLFEHTGISVLEDVHWPSGPVDGTTLAALTAEEADAVVLGADTLPADPTFAITPSARSQASTLSGPLDAVVADESLSALLSGHTPDGDALDDLTARQLLLASSAILVRELGDDTRGFLATLPREATDDGVQQRLAEVADAPWLDLANLRGLLGRAGTAEARIAPPESLTDATRLGPQALQLLEDDHETLASFAHIVTEPGQLLDTLQPAMLTSLSRAWTTDTGARAQLLQSVTERTEDLRGTIRVELGSTPNLIARTGDLPITIENELPVPANVVVGLAPQDPRLRAPEQVTAVLEPQTTTTVRLPVQGVGNGNVAVLVHVLDAPAGQSVSEGAQFAVRVRADWEDIGTVIVVGLLAVAFVVGLARTIRSGRRRFDPASAAADAGDGTGTSAAKTKTRAKRPSTAGKKAR